VILPDVSALLYAFRRDSPRHAECRWLEALVNAQAANGIGPGVLASVIIYVQPSTLDEAVEFCRVLLTPDTCTVVEPGNRHWDIFVDLCAKSGATGNLIQDAWFAALAIESGCEWVTTDRDYSRFPGLGWRTPF
jgi:uncharacterized protein